MANLQWIHQLELEKSCISPEIIERYFYSVEGEAAQQWLVGDRVAQLEDKRDNLPGHAQQYATAPVRKLNEQIERLLAQSEHVRKGGWVCRSNGQIKPDEPRQAIEKHEQTGEWLPAWNGSEPKLIKYESKREKPYQGAHVSVMEPVSEPIQTADGKPIYVIVEGGKKAGCAASIGFTALPLPGVDMFAFRDDNSAYHLIPAVEALPRDVVLVIAFDKDSKPSTKKGVALSARRLAGLLKQKGFEHIRVAGWKAADGKGLDDLCAAKGADFVRKCILEAQSFQSWQDALPKSWLKKKTARSPQWKAEYERLEKLHAAYLALPKADVVLNQKHLGEGRLDSYGMTPGSAVLLDSAMSTRKTSNFLRGIAEDHKTKFPDSWGLMSSLRNILIRQTSNVIDYKHWSDVEDGDYSCSAVPYISAAAESLAKFARNKIPAHSLFLLDEVMSYLEHIFVSDTLRNGSDRAVCVQAMKDIAEQVLDGGGWIVGCEAGLNQAAFDNFRELLPVGTSITMVRNEYKVLAGTTATIYSSPNRLKEQMLHERSTGSKLIVASDSATQVDTQMRQLFTGKNAFHISARNSNTKQAQEFAANPKGWLEKNPVKVLSYSPTLQIGSSVEDADKQWFDAGVGFFNGTLNSASCMQMIGRYRTFVPWHVYCKPSTSSGDDLSIFCPEAVRRAKLDDVEHVKELLGIADYLKQFEGGSLMSVLNRSLEGAFPIVNLIEKWQATYQAMKAWDGLHLKENLKKKLEQRGYTVIEDGERPSPGFGEVMKQVKEASIEEDGLEFAMTKVDGEKSESEAREVLTTNGHSRAAILEAKKILLMSEFPEADFNDPDFCSEYIVRGKGKRLSNIRTEWAARHPEQAKAIDRWHIKHKLKQAYNLAIGVTVGDLRAYSPQADLMAKGGVPAAIDAIGSQPYDENSADVVAVAKWARSKRAMLKKYASMKIEDDASNVDIFNRLARKLGYQPEKKQAKGKSGKGGRTYVLSDFNAPERGRMLRSLSDRFAAKLEQRGEDLQGKVSGLEANWGQKELADRQAAEAPKPIKPVAKVQAKPKLYCSPESGDLLAYYFEDDLCKAQTFQQLLEAKEKTSEATRRRVMAIWQKDGRLDALKAKSDQLRALAEVSQC